MLCTDDQTFQLRQVHSSNSVFVIQPAPSSSNFEEQHAFPAAGVKAIAQCATTLELKPSTVSGISYLKSLLPRYTGPEGNTGDTPSKSASKSKDDVWNDIPLSRAEFEAAWVSLCAFEFESQAVLPKAISLQGIWKSILSATMVRGLKLEESIHVSDIMGLVEEDGFPVALLQAVTDRLAMDQIVPMDGC